MNPKLKTFSYAVVALAGLWTLELHCFASPSSVAGLAGADGPRIHFAATNLDIGRVDAGRVINYDFIFTNIGNEPLEITEVQPTCGCTVAGEWARRVEPGKTGSIPIRYTASYIGGEISKTVIVYCNDPAQTNVVLHINGMVWEPVDVTPAYVMFGANSDRETNETQVVRIVNNMPDPLEVSDPKCYDRLFQTAIKTVKPGREYELQITLTPPLTPGNYTVPITANTSSTNLSVINITAFAAVRPAVLATPSEIILPTQISSTGAVARIIVHNYGIKPLIVSGAEVNYPGVNVQVQESQPGREFVVKATFPPKLQIRLERPVEIQIKTSHPQFPVLKVPVHQNKSLSDLLESTPNPDSIKPPNKAKK